MAVVNIEAIRTKLREIAAKTACCDDPEFNAYDYSGGNYDDAHETGMSDGEILLARELYAEFFGEE